MAKWLDKYEQGGLVLKKKTKDNYGKKPNVNDVKVSAGPGFEGEGYTAQNWKSPGWGGQFQMGGSMPGAVGFMYARTQNPAPANGKYTKKTKASAQSGTKVVSGSEPKNKKIYGAPEEDKINDWFRQYYGSDFFKENLNKGNRNVVKIDPNQVSKNTLTSMDNTNVIYSKTPEQATYSWPGTIVMGNPEIYGNQPKNETYAHEQGHTGQIDILASQPSNLLYMMNKSGRQRASDQLVKDLMAPIKQYYSGPEFKSDNEKRKKVLEDYVLSEEKLAMTNHGAALTEQRADIMALRYLAAKKGIWDASKSKPGSFTADMLNKLYKTKELNTPVTSDTPFGRGKQTHIVPGDLKQGDLKNVAPPKSPGTLLPELRKRYKDSEILFLMNILANNEGSIPTDKAQNGKEMKYYQDGLDFKPKSISQNGVKKSKKSNPLVSPYEPIYTGVANIIRGLLPTPLNVSQAVAKTVAGDSRLDETSLSDKQKVVLWNTIQNARERSGKQTGGGTEYSDYGNQGYGSSEDFNNWFNHGKINIGNGIYNSLTNPGFVMASTVGRGRYWTDPNNPDDINYTDVYDWNTHEKNYKGNNAYQTVRNLVRGKEDKNLNKDKNDKNRMNVRLTKKEIDRINEIEEMKLTSLISFKEGGVIKDDRGQWAHPGEITEIGSNNITMQGVDYPVLGISDTGDTQIMYPDQDYKFDGEKVIEYPIMKGGGWLNKYK
jgi:hypothetical protein